MTAQDDTTAGDRTLVMYGDGVRDTARRMLPKLPDSCFVPAGMRELRTAVKDGLTQVVLIAGMDEQVTLLHDTGVLESITFDMDGGAALAAEVAGAATARHAYELWEAAGKLGPCGRELCRRTAGELERLAAEAAGTAGADGADGAAIGPVAAQVVLVDAAGERMVGMYGRMAR